MCILCRTDARTSSFQFASYAKIGRINYKSSAFRVVVVLGFLVSVLQNLQDEYSFLHAYFGSNESQDQSPVLMKRDKPPNKGGQVEYLILAHVLA